MIGHIKVLKMRNDVATVIEVDGLRYVLDPSSLPKGVSTRPKLTKKPSSIGPNRVICEDGDGDRVEIAKGIMNTAMQYNWSPGTHGYVCMGCKGEHHHYPDEICWYDINGHSISSKHDVERNAQNPDALYKLLCSDCVDGWEFPQ